MINPYIELRNVNKSYRTNKQEDIQVLKNFSLSINKGEILSIYGPNGCGKSTILNIIANLISLDQGEVIVNGRYPKKGDVGCLFQDYKSSLFPWLTCSENISFSLKIQKTPKKKRKIAAQKLADSLQLKVDLEKYPYELSGGQQQLVALARALCNSPSAIVMDEPFSSLDVNMREHVRVEVLRIIDELELTGIIVSHTLEDCILCSNRVAFLTNIPAQIYSIENVPLESRRQDRETYSDKFADVLNSFRKIAIEARK